MILTENTMRWIRASINKWFDAHRSTYRLVPMGEALTEDVKTQAAYAELRMMGPSVREVLSGQGTINIGISVMCSALMTNDLYLLDRIVGVFQVAFAPCIQIFKLGTDAGDDQSQLGILTLRNDVSRPVDTVQWGQLDPTTKLQQTSIEGSYKMEL